MKFITFLIVIGLLWISPSRAEEGLNLEQKFNLAKSHTLEEDFRAAFNQIYNDHPDSFYGQMSLLELAKNDILNRAYTDAVAKLRKINHPEIGSKEYWLANAYFKDNKFQEAIISAQNFIFDSTEKDMIEKSYFLIAEAYIKQKQFSRALNTLDFLRNSEFIENNIPLLHFKIGYCQEMLGNYDDAIRSYKKLKVDYPYHQYSYQAEDRIYDLSRNGNKIPPEQLQEFQELDPEPVIKPEITDGEEIQSEEVIPQKLEEQSRTQKSYLQVGAFSTRDNAMKLAQEINELISVSHIIFLKDLKGRELHVLAYGPFSSESELIETKSILKSGGYNSFRINRY